MPAVDEKIEVVKVGEQYYLADEWVAAYNTVFLELLEQKLAAASTMRAVMRVVRGMKKKGLAEVCLQRARRLIVQAGKPVTFVQDQMAIAARFPGMSDPPAKVD